MATNLPVVFPMSDGYVIVETKQPLADGIIIPLGTPAVYDNAVGKIKQATKALLAAGAPLLGIALETTDNSDNRFSTNGPRLIFARNTQWQAPKNVGAPGVTFVGQSAAIQDNETVTLAGMGDVTFRVDALPDEGGAIIWIP